MTVQEIEQTIPTLDMATLRRLQALVEAQLRGLDGEPERVPYARIADLAGVISDAPADLSSTSATSKAWGLRTTGDSDTVWGDPTPAAHGYLDKTA